MVLGEKHIYSFKVSTAYYTGIVLFLVTLVTMFKQSVWHVHETIEHVECLTNVNNTPDKRT